MLTAGTMGRIAEALPRHKGGMVGAYYLLTILAGVFVLFFQGRMALAADFIATIVYIALTILFYAMSKKRLTSEGRGLIRNEGFEPYLPDAKGDHWLRERARKQRTRRTVNDKIEIEPPGRGSGSPPASADKPTTRRLAASPANTYSGKGRSPGVIVAIKC